MIRPHREPARPVVDRERQRGERPVAHAEQSARLGEVRQVPGQRVAGDGVQIVELQLALERGRVAEIDGRQQRHDEQRAPAARLLLDTAEHLTLLHWAHPWAQGMTVPSSDRRSPPRRRCAR